MNTFTFISSCGKFEFTVLTKFLDKNHLTVLKESVYNLMVQYHLGDYLHNSTGPAILYKDNGNQTYYLEGKVVTDPHIIQSINFNNKINTLLTEED